MVDEVICPDCGGVVGATHATEAGAPCTCFVGKISARMNKSSGDTAVDASPVTAPPGPQKPCVICGKDLVGHRRIRESRGYLCMECAKEEEKRDAGGRVRCRPCGRLVKETVMEEYDGVKMCPQCHREQLELQKEKIKRIGISTAHEREQRKGLMILAGIGGFLLLIILLNWLHLLPHHF